MNVEFKIFGTPDGFDLYQGNEEEIEYFQAFDDNSTENTKLIVHRMPNGQVSYSYLKYGLISSENRAGAFFGMSILFKDEYCKEIRTMYELFGRFYHQILVENILIEISENSNSQAKFLIHRFEEQEKKVKNIRNDILVEIKKIVIHPLDSSFKQNKTDELTDKININKDNDVILKALQNHSRVAISSEYSENNFLEKREVTNEEKENQKKQPKPLTPTGRILWFGCAAVVVIIFICLFIWILCKE